MSLKLTADEWEKLQHEENVKLQRAENLKKGREALAEKRRNAALRQQSSSTDVPRVEATPQNAVEQPHNNATWFPSISLWDIVYYTGLITGYLGLQLYTKNLRSPPSHTVPVEKINEEKSENTTAQFTTDDLYV